MRKKGKFQKSTRKVSLYLKKMFTSAHGLMYMFQKSSRKIPRSKKGYDKFH